MLGSDEKMSVNKEAQRTPHVRRFLAAVGVQKVCKCTYERKEEKKRAARRVTPSAEREKRSRVFSFVFSYRPAPLSCGRAFCILRLVFFFILLIISPLIYQHCRCCRTGFTSPFGDLEVFIQTEFSHFQSAHKRLV